jgi:hypothetical protein
MDSSFGYKKQKDDKGLLGILMVIVAITLCIILMVSALIIAGSSKKEASASPVVLNHRVETWISALEWCESAGITEAINPRDSDGTPSYYSFQWKPGTFRMYAERYGLISKGMTDEEIMGDMQDYELEREIIRKMVDDPRVNWEKEFPDCIKKKVGLPPAGN